MPDNYLALTPEKPADAFRTGVVTVHQSINDGVIPDLDVASNLMLDQLNQKDFGFFVKDSLLRKRAEKIAQNMKLEINMKTQVSELGIAVKALVSNITRKYADIIREEVATEPIDKSKPSTTSVQVTPKANIPVMATDWKMNTADLGPANPLAKIEKKIINPTRRTKKPYFITKTFKSLDI